MPTSSNDILEHPQHPKLRAWSVNVVQNVEKCCDVLMPSHYQCHVPEQYFFWWRLAEKHSETAWELQKGTCYSMPNSSCKIHLGCAFLCTLLLNVPVFIFLQIVTTHDNLEPRFPPADMSSLFATGKCLD